MRELLYTCYSLTMSAFAAFAVWQAIVFALFLRGAFELDETTDSYTDLGEDDYDDTDEEGAPYTVPLLPARVPYLESLRRVR